MVCLLKKYRVCSFFASSAYCSEPKKRTGLHFLLLCLLSTYRTVLYSRLVSKDNTSAVLLYVLHTVQFVSVNEHAVYER